MQVEAALEPLLQRIVGREHRERADHARPLQAAEREVVGIERLLAAEERRVLERHAQRLEARAEALDALLAAGLDLLERAPETLLAAGAEVVLVRGRQALPDVEDDQTDQPGVEHGGAPGLHEARQLLAAGAAEQRGPLGVGGLEVAGDRPAVDQEAVAVAQRRHGLDAAVLDLRDLGEARRPRLVLEPLVGERHAGPPAMRREPPVLAPDQVVHHDRHRFLSERGCQCLGMTTRGARVKP